MRNSGSKTLLFIRVRTLQSQSDKRPAMELVMFWRRGGSFRGKGGRVLRGLRRGG